MSSIVLQIIRTVQGEGPTVGYPINLIRFYGCNLNCSWCDTKWSVQERPKVCEDFDVSDIFKMLPPFTINDKNKSDFIFSLKEDFQNIKRVMITGGEPLLHIDLIEDIIDFYPDHFFEIETNGVDLIEHIDILETYRQNIQLNISPKYDAYDGKYDLSFLKATAYLQKILDINFKFVYRQDLETNLLNFIKRKTPVDANICVMAMTPKLNSKNFEETYRTNCRQAVAFCINNNLRYTPREHVFLFGNDKHERI